MSEPRPGQEPAEELQPSRVREKILLDHRQLREELAPIEELAKRVVEGDESAAAELRSKAERFHENLARHMTWEDEHLAPTLRDIDAWGEERVGRLAAEHAEQRERLASFLEHLHDDQRSKREVAKDILELGSWLREDMEGEERITLDPNVVKDDPIVVDVEAG